MRVALAALLLLIVASGCAAPRAGTTLVWSKELAYGVDGWRREAEARFGPGVLLVVCHGDAAADGRWEFVPDDAARRAPVQQTVEQLRRDNPGRPIVLVTCNPGGFDLRGLRGVYYARRSVLVPPYEHDASLRRRWADKAAGTIWEMSDHP